MTRTITKINAGIQDTSRPSERPPKTNWKTELVKKGLATLQHISPGKTAEVVWHYFTKPGTVRFKESHLELLDQAQTFSSNYKGYRIQGYRWGTSGPKVLLVHGWRSKISDFRRMIFTLVEAGYIVEGLDMKAHGKSEGKHTAIPEMRDIIKDHYVKEGPYHAVIGYSIGGLAASMVLTEVGPALQPKHLFIIASPPYVRYFFKDIIDDLGFSNEVYEAMAKLVKSNYHEDIDYFDLRDKQHLLQSVDMTLIYDEIDKTVPFERGKELFESYPDAHFVHTTGLGHYKIIAYEAVFKVILKQMKSEMIPSFTA
ncbi:alpha/beta fold hydrolase [Marinoscillum sp.]|uniref:alpha/beta hydrolase n=1 Tax=Marinoscillum sp. TaxID=2024838 RepID=UPI003BABFD2A